MKALNRIGWTAIVLFVGFKVAVLGSLAWEQITGHPPAFITTAQMQ